MNQDPVTRLNIKQLAQRLGCSAQTIWRWYKFGDFPEPHFFLQNRLWTVAEVERWEREHVMSRSHRPSIGK